MSTESPKPKARPSAQNAGSDASDTSPNAEATNPNAPDPPDDTPSVDEQRDDQLKAGKAKGAARTAARKLAKGTPAEQRAGYLGARPTDGRVDNMTRRDDTDVLQGHFCQIDFGDKEFGDAALKAVELAIGEGNAGLGRGDYGVYTEPGELDDDGYPITANVLLRDEHAALVGGVPYGALRPANAGRR